MVGSSPQGEYALPPDTISRSEMEHNYTSKGDCAMISAPLVSDMGYLKTGQNNMNQNLTSLNEKMDNKFDRFEERIDLKLVVITKKLDDMILSQVAIGFVKNHWKGLTVIFGTIVTIIGAAIGIPIVWP